MVTHQCLSRTACRSFCLDHLYVRHVTQLYCILYRNDNNVFVFVSIKLEQFLTSFRLSLLGPVFTVPSSHLGTLPSHRDACHYLSLFYSLSSFARALIPADRPGPWLWITSDIRLQRGSCHCRCSQAPQGYIVLLFFPAHLHVDGYSCHVRTICCAVLSYGVLLRVQPEHLPQPRPLRPELLRRNLLLITGI